MTKSPLLLLVGSRRGVAIHSGFRYAPDQASWVKRETLYVLIKFRL